ncbi:MAG: FAD-dependent oxidoreductase [Synechococcaceae cyanobacterium SM2_3_1]|nr:FAD-dependent oxidoreductase [Synechococcaceae cyanobacterium SM2_3_1]
MAVPYDVIVIGGGSGGLVVASAAAQLKAKVLLVEKEHRIGGDCLWYGCVPSKSLIHVAHLAHQVRQAAQSGLVLNSGLNGSGIHIDYLKVYHHIKGAQDFIANHADSPDRFRKLGVELVFGSGRFVDRKTFEVNGTRYRARSFVISTGSRPQIPDVKGLQDVGFLTNEKIFDLTHRPESVAVVGGGPIGCELGQALARLGVRVTLIGGSKPQILPKEDPEAARVVQQKLEAEGIAIINQDRAAQALLHEGKKHLLLKSGKRIAVDEIVVASGRVPNVEELNLDTAGVKYDREGVKVNSKLQTTNPRIFACGDVIGGHQFTHVAGFEAVTVLKNAVLIPNFLGFLRSNVNYRVIPWATFTDPELARVGLTEAEAREQYGRDVAVLKHEFAEVDRGQAEAETEGFSKIICRQNGQILGATIVGPSAGELLHEIVLAMNYKLPVSALTGIHVYPTLSEVNAKAALQLSKQKYAKNQGLQNFLRGFFGWLRSLES